MSSTASKREKRIARALGIEEDVLCAALQAHVAQDLLNLLTASETKAGDPSRPRAASRVIDQFDSGS
jgi:hypothetical protein